VEKFYKQNSKIFPEPRGTSFRPALSWIRMPTLETSLSLREDPATANLAGAAADTPVGRTWISAPQLAAELGVSRRTIGRWLLDLALEFPRPKIVNHRLYFERGAVEAWKTATAVKVAEAR
jgi:predicted DNA-binding transcriptional regulator AlpA